MSETPTTTTTPEQPPKCGEIFDAGIKNSRDLIRGLGALMGDVALSRVIPQRANAICNAAGKILTTVHLEYKFGNGDAAGGVPHFSLEAGGARRDGPRPRLAGGRGSTSTRSVGPPRVRAK